MVPGANTTNTHYCLLSATVPKFRLLKCLKVMHSSKETFHVSFSVQSPATSDEINDKPKDIVQLVSNKKMQDQGVALQKERDISHIQDEYHYYRSRK